MKIRWIHTEPTRISPTKNGKKIEVQTGDVIEVDEFIFKQLEKMYKNCIQIYEEPKKEQKKKIDSKK